MEELGAWLAVAAVEVGPYTEGKRLINVKHGDSPRIGDGRCLGIHDTSIGSNETLDMPPLRGMLDGGCGCLVYCCVLGPCAGVLMCQAVDPSSNGGERHRHRRLRCLTEDVLSN